jgi:hypothetical protein
VKGLRLDRIWSLWGLACRMRLRVDALERLKVSAFSLRKVRVKREIRDIRMSRNSCHNENPKPFIWTAKANDIPEKVTRAKDRAQ